MPRWFVPRPGCPGKPYHQKNDFQSNYLMLLQQTPLCVQHDTFSSICTSCVKFLPVAIFTWWPPTHNWTILCGFLQKMFQFGLTFSRKMVPIQDRPTSFEANHCKKTSFKFEFSILPRCSAHLDGGEPLAYVAMPPHFDGWHQDTNLPTVSLPSISAFPPQSFWSGNTVCQWCLLNKTISMGFPADGLSCQKSILLYGVIWFGRHEDVLKKCD